MIEQVESYGTALTMRQVRALAPILRKAAANGEPGAVALEDQIDWLYTGIMTADRDMAPLAGKRDESPSDYE